MVPAGSPSRRVISFLYDPRVLDGLGRVGVRWLVDWVVKVSAQ